MRVLVVQYLVTTPERYIHVRKLFLDFFQLRALMYLPNVQLGMQVEIDYGVCATYMLVLYDAHKNRFDE